MKHAANGTGGSVFEAIADATTTNGLGLNGIDLLVDGTTFSNNHSTLLGGVGFVSGVKAFEIKDSVQSANKADTDGGAYAFANGSDGKINGSTFSGNSAKNAGGALLVSNTAVKIDKSVFDGNTAVGRCYQD